MTVGWGRRDSKVRQRWQDGRDTIKSRDRGVLPCLSSRASGTSRGISNSEPLPSCGKGTCLGADHTKEFLSFGKQPSFFKGRNQSWFHPLRTPSRPGAAAPGPHRGQRAMEVLSHAIDRPRCTDRQLLGVAIRLSSYYFLRTRQGFAFSGG